LCAIDRPFPESFFNKEEVMSATELARRWFEEVWNQRRDDTMDEMLSPNCAGFIESHGDITTPDEFKAVRAKFLEAMPDLSLTVEDAIAEGDKVVVRWRAKATHRGPGLGTEPTGCACEFRGLTWLEFENGKIVRGWDGWDHGGLVRHLMAASQA
jgi:steroid delta-isomerase-like uncharacterized protein